LSIIQFGVSIGSSRSLLFVTIDSLSMLEKKVNAGQKLENLNAWLFAQIRNLLIISYPPLNIKLFQLFSSNDLY